MGPERSSGPGLHFLPCPRLLLGPTCFTPYQPARSATESLMLQWFQRTRRMSGRIWPGGNNRICSIFFPSSQPCSWHLQTQLSWPSLWWFTQSGYLCALENTDFITHHCGNKAKQNSLFSPCSDALYAAGRSAGSKKICGRDVVCAERLRKALAWNTGTGIASVQLLITHYSDQQQPGISDKQKFLHSCAGVRFFSREGSSSCHISNNLWG